MRPTAWNEFVGQEKAKAQLDILKISAETRNASLPHCVFSGSSGSGKTTAARILSGDKKFWEINAASIKSINDIIKILERLEEKDIVFLDEIHALPSKIQEFLYIVIEDFEYEKGMSRVKLPKFTLIGATTHIGLLNPPLRNRFKHIIEFTDYSLEELAIIVKKVAKNNLGLELSDKFTNLIAGTCRGNPRNTINRAEWIRDCILHESKNSSIEKVCKTITPEKLFKYIQMQGVDKYGLSDIELKYLDILSESMEPLGLSSLSSKLGLVRENIINDIEPYLMKLGLVKISSRGRMIEERVFRNFYPLREN